MAMRDQAARSRWGSGFAWGCLTPLLVLGLLIAGGIVYSGYFMTLGFRGDDSFKTVLTAVQSHPLAKDILGDKIAAQGSPSYNITYSTGGMRARYAFAVRGTHADGAVEAEVTRSNGKATITALVLTGPDGRRYDLLDPRTRSLHDIRFISPGPIRTMPSSPL